MRLSYFGNSINTGDLGLERERERERERETDRQTDRQTDRDTERERESQTKVFCRFCTEFDSGEISGWTRRG